MTLEEVRTKAREKLKGICGVYQDCDGIPSRRCQGHSYGSPIGIGGAGTGSSFANNVKALAAIQLNLRVIGEHFVPDTSATLFGHEVSMPVYGAPATGVDSFGGADVIAEEDFCRATVNGCKQAGTIGWRGDVHTYSPDRAPGIEAIREAGGWGIKISKPRDQETIIKILQRAEAAGALGVGVDVDGCGSYNMDLSRISIYRKSKDELKELVESVGLPFVVKGLMCPSDAEAAVEVGASAIVVSNHAGRVLDHTPGTADVLPEIVRAVRGDVKILVDGGVRTGYDVLKMLALGAEGVLVGRDIIRAAIGGGEEGVRLQMEYLRETLSKAMLMTGCKDVKSIDGSILYQD
jgi:isopentenyl diphosphate isomerase/L-lactate dehydrogenase-like FMN-dependent dehydrogenase